MATKFGKSLKIAFVRRMEALLVEKIGSGIIWYLICKVANKG